MGKKIREVALRIKDNKYFDYFILTIIFGSSFILVRRGDFYIL